MLLLRLPSFTPPQGICKINHGSRSEDDDGNVDSAPKKGEKERDYLCHFEIAKKRKGKGQYWHTLAEVWDLFFEELANTYFWLVNTSINKYVTTQKNLKVNGSQDAPHE